MLGLSVLSVLPLNYTIVGQRCGNSDVEVLLQAYVHQSRNKCVLSVQRNELLGFARARYYQKEHTAYNKQLKRKEDIREG